MKTLTIALHGSRHAMQMPARATLQDAVADFLRWAELPEFLLGRCVLAKTGEPRVPLRAGSRLGRVPEPHDFTLRLLMAGHPDLSLRFNDANLVEFLADQALLRLELGLLRLSRQARVAVAGHVCRAEFGSFDERRHGIGFLRRVMPWVAPGVAEAEVLESWRGFSEAYGVCGRRQVLVDLLHEMERGALDFGYETFSGEVDGRPATLGLSHEDVSVWAESGEKVLSWPLSRLEVWSDEDGSTFQDSLSGERFLVSGLDTGSFMRVLRTISAVVKPQTEDALSLSRLSSTCSFGDLTALAASTDAPGGDGV